MPPSFLQEEIAELFAEAAERGREWYPHDSYIIRGRARAEVPPPRSDGLTPGQRQQLRRREIDVSNRAKRVEVPFVIEPVGVRVEVCPLCGGRLEYRAGNPHHQAIHIGYCRRP